MHRHFKKLLMCIVLLAACSSGDIQPAAIEDGDMCSFCRMAISEKQYAAEIITAGDAVSKFDDIGCMLRYRKAAGENLKIAATFVMDHNSREWLRAEKAVYVRSGSIKTPMGSGIIAFSDGTKAGADGLTFEALLSTADVHQH